jgi:hypothetical protein
VAKEHGAPGAPAIGRGKASGQTGALQAWGLRDAAQPVVGLARCSPGAAASARPEHGGLPCLDAD